VGIDVTPVKDDVQRPVPSAWRPVLREIVEAIRRGDAALAAQIPSVRAVDPDTAAQIRDYVADYGEALVPLPEEAWDTSVALWLGGHWQVLVDLWTEPLSRSDLVLHVTVVAEDGQYGFEVGPVYVP
jgi:hypothetical protein